MRVIATAGHVDHGKSTLIRHLTGTDPDRLEEERRRGLTIDLGFAAAVLPSGAEVGFVDVPGHARFVKNMLAGVGAVDACLFVVAANEGWKPQSEEHLRILELLGVGGGAVVLTKAGLVDDEWLELAEMEVAERVAGSFLEGAETVAVDVPSGIGLDGEGGLVGVLERLVAATPPAIDRNRPRLYIDRSFALAGAGTVVTGTLTGGSVAVDDRLVVEPGRRPVRVRGLHSHGRPLQRASPGRRLAVSLSGMGHREVRRGAALVWEGDWHLSARLDATLTVLAGAGRPIGRRGAFVGYFGSGEYPVRLSPLGGAAEIGPGETGSVRLRLPVALPLLPGDRYVLRDAGRAATVGGGEVLDVAPVLPVSKAAPSRSVERVVAERGFVDAVELERLTGEHRSPDVGRFVADPAALRAAAAALRETVRAAGAVGVDLALLGERERLLAEEAVDLVVIDGRVLLRELTSSARPLEQHPYLAALAASKFEPPAPEGVDRVELRALERHGLVVCCDGVYFAASAADEAAARVARLLSAAPEGVTAAAVRDELGTTRRFVLPLLTYFDATGVTRRRGDLRVAGPRLPGTGTPAR